MLSNILTIVVTLQINMSPGCHLFIIINKNEAGKYSLERMNTVIPTCPVIYVIYIPYGKEAIVKGT